METEPNTAFFARATKTLPGPTILSTFGTDSVPKAMAAMAWAPPTLKIRSAPASAAATRVEAATLPSLLQGVHMMISDTPATLAGTIFMRTEEG